MKKIFAVMLASMLLLSGCGKKKADDAATTGTNTEATNGDTAQNKDNTEAAQQANESVTPQVDEAIVTSNEKPGDYTTSFIAKFIESGTYYIKRNVTTSDGTVASEVAAEGRKVAVRESEGTKIIDGDMLYYVFPEQKTVLTSPVADSMKEGFTNFIVAKAASAATDKFVGASEEEVNGEKLTCEEFKDADGNTVKYYYDSKTIRYVKQISGDGSETMTQILVLSHTVPAGFFDVPDGYTVQDLSKMG